MANCKHKNKSIEGMYFLEDNHKYVFSISLEKDVEYSTLDIEKIVDEYIENEEEKMDMSITHRKYSVICMKCGNEVEIW